MPSDDEDSLVVDKDDGDPGTYTSREQMTQRLCTGPSSPPPPPSRRWRRPSSCARRRGPLCTQSKVEREGRGREEGRDATKEVD